MFLLPLLFVRPTPAQSNDGYGFKFTKIEWWMLTGGVIGAACASINVFAAPKIGMAFFFVTVITAQLLCSLLLDHFGIGVRRSPISFMKVCGLVVIGIGLVFVQGSNYASAGSSSSSNLDLIMGSVLAFTTGIILPLQVSCL